MRVDNRGCAGFRYWTAAAAAAVLSMTGFAPEAAQTEQDEAAHIRGHIAGRIAHHICAGLFVVGRDYERSLEEVVAQDLEPFGDPPEGFEHAVDHDTRTASVASRPRWSARRSRRAISTSDSTIRRPSRNGRGRAIRAGRSACATF